MRNSSRPMTWKPRKLTAVLLALATLAFSGAGHAQDCLSLDPGDWPLPARPYFMIAYDSSYSMGDTVAGPSSSCGYGNRRVDHARCAAYNTVKAFGGVSFGLAQFATEMSGCDDCFDDCEVAAFDNDSVSDNPLLWWTYFGCGREDDDTSILSPTRRGANILVPLWVDNFWDPVPEPNNVDEILAWVDNDCTDSQEISAEETLLLEGALTPLNGVLRDMMRYFETGWWHPDDLEDGTPSPTYPSPLGTLAQGELACRSVNVILVTDGEETCDAEDAVYDAARALYEGFTKDGIEWHIRTHVINFIGGLTPQTNQIADFGDDGIDNNSAEAYFASDETQLAQALSTIISDALRPEVCDNQDNDCNGCVDEGYFHYCNVDFSACDPWDDPAEHASNSDACECCGIDAGDREACLASYEASISDSNPTGDLWRLPCTSVEQQEDEDEWLCYNPGDACDYQDNNCDGSTDEGALLCGDPLHCPEEEVCDGQDNNCDGVIDLAYSDGDWIDLCGAFVRCA